MCGGLWTHSIVITGYRKVVRYDEKKPGVEENITMGIMEAGGGHPIQWKSLIVLRLCNLTSLCNPGPDDSTTVWVSMTIT